MVAERPELLGSSPLRPVLPSWRSSGSQGTWSGPTSGWGTPPTRKLPRKWVSLWSLSLSSTPGAQSPGVASFVITLEIYTYMCESESVSPSRRSSSLASTLGVGTADDTVSSPTQPLGVSVRARVLCHHRTASQCLRPGRTLPGERQASRGRDDPRELRHYLPPPSPALSLLRGPMGPGEHKGCVCVCVRIGLVQHWLPWLC